ncbi:hypothetical protein MNBD_GAMMA18-2364 [hydrothermal vent metagenome]|uniref:Uncharacterized protein n=1 Tax=hydrothermal vent metagenome TaxID=652676 RepID=A0A3B0ZA45_9ZZZZ
MNYKGITGTIKGFRVIDPIILAGALCSWYKKSLMSAVQAVLKSQKYRHQHDPKSRGWAGHYGVAIKPQYSIIKGISYHLGNEMMDQLLNREVPFRRHFSSVSAIHYQKNFLNNNKSLS